MKKLAVEKSLKSVRVWGKILGLDSNYFVIEAELKDGASDEDEIAEPEEEVKEVAEPAADDSEIGKIPIPKMKTKVTVPVPKESRTGVNKYIYYVSTHAGSEWIRLPDVIPECLQVSRQIRKYFTGNLNKSINSYPVFKGNEAQLLRCQIARISASTVVSPAGYYAFDPEEEAGEDSERNFI